MKRKIYIVPTRFGMVFCLGILIMLLVGATYANNLVNMLAFFLTSLGLVAMVQTNQNLKDVELKSCQVEGGFASSTIALSTLFSNTTTQNKFNLEVRAHKLQFSRETEELKPLSGHSSSGFRSWYEAERRGVYQLKIVKLSTVYPLGLFYAWTLFRVDSPYFIYPKPDGTLPLPAANTETLTTTKHQRRAGSGDDFSGHRRFQQGDSHRHIDWKAHARGRPLLVKEFQAGENHEVHLDWFQLPLHWPHEQKLSQLAAWIELARRKQMTYSLRLPHLTIRAGSGRQHDQRCLEELAQFEDDHGSVAR